MLRITVEGGVQAFLFGCPYCRAEIRGVLQANSDGSFPLQSEDFDRLEVEETGEELAVAVDTVLPVNKSSIGQPAREALLTPFMLAQGVIGDGKSIDLMHRIETIRALRERMYPYVRRAASYFGRREVNKIAEVLATAPGGDEIDWNEVDPVNALGVAFAQLYAPFEDLEMRHEAAVEWLQVIRQARTASDDAFREVYDEFSAGPLGRHHARVLDTVVSLLGDTHALFPALWAELIREENDLSDYRVMRDDFDSLKVRYQDIFELASRTLAFTSRVANLAYRGDARQYSDGDVRTLNKALNKTTSFKREHWLDDFPVAKEMFESMQRGVRNNIGHRLVRYDFESGCLVYEDDEKENYLNFLIGYLNATRLSHYLLDVCETLWYQREFLQG